MPTRCIGAGCSNTKKDGVSLHMFPKDPATRRLWTAKVKLTIAPIFVIQRSFECKYRGKSKVALTKLLLSANSHRLVTHTN